jgi:multimeric flavodoxin WrbA
MYNNHLGLVQLINRRSNLKILAIIGSPRKCNTYKVVQQVEKRMKEFGEIDFEYLYLKDTNLKSCLGCSRCLLIGEDKCPLIDERKNIENKIFESDGIILASPNYLCNVSALMKNFLDRFAYCGHRPRFFHKNAMVICTSAGPGGLNQCIKSLSYIAGAGFNIVKKVGIITPFYQLAQSIQEKANLEIDKSAKKFYEAICKDKIRKPTLMDIMKFRAIRSFLLCKNDYLPSDYEYWNSKGWLGDKEYFYDESLSYFKRIFGRFIEFMCNIYYKHVLLKGII